ncbi:hypothetical protein AB0K34_33965 [Actinomadura sp. NPDC049382]|uniref:hypothetical protein n=1 Tax=Actinomadura sp. NPDC049382 TaxID=3158220 RepID=UPI003431BEEA
MRKLARRALTAIAATATAAALTAAPAAADPVTYTIQNGGYLTGFNVGSFIGFGEINGATLECTSSTITAWTRKDTSGNPIVNGTANGDGIATLDNVTFSSPGQVNDWCVANGTFPTQVTPLGLPWMFNATGEGTSSGPGGTTDGRLTGVQFKLHIEGWGLCDAIIGGPGAGGSDSYYEATYYNPSTLTDNDGALDIPYLGSQNAKVLSISDPEGCWMLSVGETFEFVGMYNLTRTTPNPPAAGISPTID